MCYGLLLHQIGHIIGINHQFNEALAFVSLSEEQIASDYITQIHREFQHRKEKAIVDTDLK